MRLVKMKEISSKRDVKDISDLAVGDFYDGVKWHIPTQNDDKFALMAGHEMSD